MFNLPQSLPFPLTVPQLLPFDWQIVPNATARQWAVYMHLSQPQPELAEHVLYVGYCRIIEVFNSPDARRNLDWLTKTSDNLITLSIIGTTEDMIIAHNEAHKLVMHYRPIYNSQGRQLPRRSRVRCEEDGKIFESSAIAARHYGVAVQTMSNHINRRQGYEKIRGVYTIARYYG